MDRITERNGNMIMYTGKHTKIPGLDCAASMRVGAIRDVLNRLADYEDTGLTPEQIKNMQPQVSGR